MKRLIALSAGLLGLVATSLAEEDTTPPTITMTAPANGIENALFTDRVTVTGDATDDVGVTRVEYRIENRGRWRRATLTNPGELSTSYVFSYKNKKKGRARRVYVRALDACKNESDTIGRKIYRSRRNEPLPAAPANPTPTPTPGIGIGGLSVRPTSRFAL